VPWTETINPDADPGLKDFIANNSWGTKQDMESIVGVGDARLSSGASGCLARSTA